MKFKFCGNVDCPDWLITEITYLTKITPVKLRILGNLICKYIMKEGDTQKNNQNLRRNEFISRRNNNSYIIFMFYN